MELYIMLDKIEKYILGIAETMFNKDYFVYTILGLIGIFIYLVFLQ